MIFYKDATCIFLEISEKELIPITQRYKGDSDFCIYKLNINELSKCNKIELHEILFNENIKKKLLEKAKHTRFNIELSCYNCNFYSICKYQLKALKNIEKTNKILKEYKKIVQNIKEID